MIPRLVAFLLLWVSGTALAANPDDEACAPAPLLFTMIPKKDMDEQLREYRPLIHLLSEGLGVPVDKLKLDRSLIARISNSHDDSPVVSSTIILAKRMNLEVVAEGVETPEQLVHLKVAGCDIAQGYHLSRPMPAADVPGFTVDFNRLQESA